MSGKYIIKNIDKVNIADINALKRFDSATIYEAQGKVGLVNRNIKPIQNGVTICGSAVTVVCQAGDNLMIHAAIEVCEPHDILVVTTIGDSNAGMIGELIVSALQKKQVQGLIIDSGIRDVERIRQLGFPVWTKSISPEGTNKVKGGWVNSEAVCGGCIVKPGDVVIADDDGVVIVCKNMVGNVLLLAESRFQKEIETKRKIASGELSIDFYSLRGTLEKANVKYYESIEEMRKGDSDV